MEAKRVSRGSRAVAKPVGTPLVAGEFEVNEAAGRSKSAISVVAGLDARARFTGTDSARFTGTDSEGEKTFQLAHSGVLCHVARDVT